MKKKIFDEILKDYDRAIDWFYNKMETGSIEGDEEQIVFEIAINALEKMKELEKK
jgi:hypothetical protein